MRRRLPAPWVAEDLNDACFVVRDANGLALAYVYYVSESIAAQAAGAGKLTRDEARRVAANVVRLPELLKRDGA